MVALWGGIGALAVATGPSLGALLITGFGWRAAFFVNLPIGLVAWLVGRRVLTESTDRRHGPRPTTPAWCSWGSAGRAGAGHLRGSDLGMDEPGRPRRLRRRRRAGRASSSVRSARHHEPVLDLTALPVPSFSVANLATLLYAMGFFAMLLGNILFLTSVWRYSILTPVWP